jgi:hypothetical protein
LAARGLTTSIVVHEHLDDRLARRRRYLIGGGLVGLFLVAPSLGVVTAVAVALLAGLLSELRWTGGSTAADAEDWAGPEQPTVRRRAAGMWGSVALGLVADLALLSLRAHTTHVHHGAVAVAFILAVPLLLAVGLRLVHRRHGDWHSGDAAVDEAIDRQLVQHANGAALALLVLTAFEILHRFVPHSYGSSGSFGAMFGGLAVWGIAFFGSSILAVAATGWLWWSLTRPSR